MNTRGFRRTLNGLMAAAFVAAFAIPAMTHDAPVGGFVGSRSDVVARPSAEPHWKPAYAARFDNCGPDKPTIPGDVVIVDQDGQVRRMSFDVAWRRTHNAGWADDVWVVGFCR